MRPIWIIELYKLYFSCLCQCWSCDNACALGRNKKVLQGPLDYSRWLLKQEYVPSTSKKINWSVCCIFPLMASDLLPAIYKPSGHHRSISCCLIFSPLILVAMLVYVLYRLALLKAFISHIIYGLVQINHICSWGLRSCYWRFDQLEGVRTREACHCWHFRHILP